MKWHLVVVSVCVSLWTNAFERYLSDRLMTITSGGLQ